MTIYLRPRGLSYRARSLALVNQWDWDYHLRQMDGSLAFAATSQNLKAELGLFWSFWVEE